MRRFTGQAHGLRWLPMTACVLVFLFAFHGNTGVYRWRLQRQATYGEGVEAVDEEPQDPQASSACQLPSVFGILRL
jgi:hypothetical protein